MATLAVRNQNPGNLRDPSTGGFQSFDNPTEGKAALYNDLTAKMTGTSTTGLNGKSSLLEFAKVYAPASDNNDPVQYAANLANKLGVSPDTPIGTLQPRIDDFASAVASNEDPSAHYSQSSTTSDNPFVGYTPSQTGDNPFSSQNPFTQTQEQPKTNFIQDLAASTIQPFQELGLTEMNLLRKATGNPTVNSQENIFDENKTVEPFNIRNGQQLSAGQTIGKGLGDVAQTVATVGLPGEEAAALGAKGILPKLYENAKAFGKFGALQSGGSSLSQGNDIGTVAKDTAVGGGVGAATGLAFGTGALALKGLANKVGEGVTLATDKEGAQKLAVDSLTKDWQEPLNQPTASFTKARQVVEKSPDTPAFLAQQGIDPKAHVEDGRYVTKDTADSLRDTAGTMSQETLRPSLQEADTYTPRTSVDDVVQQAIKEVNATPNVTPGNKTKILSQIESEANALKQEYPNGMSLTDMHDHKITYAKNGGYSPVNDPLVNNTATANRAISSALGKKVEANAPKEIPVHDFNQYLSKYYKSADYLDALNTKKAPVSLTQNIARWTAKFGGAAAGAHFGGGVVSEFAGYQVGKAIEHAVENLSNPARAMFLRNIEKTNPAAMKQIEKYMQERASTKAGQLKLPPPSFIPMGTPTPKPTEGAQLLSAEKGPVGVNPKTGKFMKTYKSTYQKPSPSEASQPAAIPPNIANMITPIKRTLPHTDEGASGLLKGSIGLKTLMGLGGTTLGAMTGAGLLSKSGLLDSKKEEYKASEGKTYTLPNRKTKINNQDLNELGAILFGEIGNRSPEKNYLEAKTIANVALNRADKEGKPLEAILKEPKQFQALNGNQYKLFKEGKIDKLSEQKADAIKKVIGEIMDGKLDNNIGDNQSYAHRKDGTIRVYKDWKEQQKDLANIK